MKLRVLVSALLGLTLALFLTPVRADSGWTIDKFNSLLELQSSGSLNITETIDVDFGINSKHGIFRTIPFRYQNKDGSNYFTEEIVSSVTQDGSAAKYQLTTRNNDIEIKIGDANKTISGKHRYEIFYRASGVILPYDQYDELYWNATGNNWEVPISNASATIKLPAGDFLQSSCYFGRAGSTETCSINTVKTSMPALTVFSAPRPLQPGEGLTIAAGFTKGLVPILRPVEPPSGVNTADFRRIVIEFLGLGLAGLLTFFTLWLVRGRDQKDATNRETVVAEYEPPLNLRPAEIGTLIDQKADTLDVTATIVDLAVRGYLTITELPKKFVFSTADYLLKQTNKTPNNLRAYEELLIKSLFEGDNEKKTSDLREHFSSDLAKIKNAIYKEVTDKKLFVENPQNTRQKYFGISIVLIIVGGISLSISLIGFGIGLILSGLFGLIFAGAMSRRTVLGREALRQVKGYKLFVSGTEKYRQPYFEKENIFMDVLPYAIVFGVTGKLAAAFKEMGIKPPQPSWYIGSHPFVPAVFASDINHFSNSLSSAMASVPHSSGSGGGGFSGGGFGGGGGGGW